MNPIASESSLIPSSSGVRRIASGMLCLALIALTSCSFLKPAQSVARHFVLTTIATNAPASTLNPLALGVGQVRLPSYLFNTPMAVRKGANEVEHLPTANWAERLDAGFQRVLAANLATLLGTDRVYLSAWQKSDVAVELHVIIEQFDVDTSGRGQLSVRWRVVSPAGDQVLKSGISRIERTGPAPGTDAAGAVATLSELVGDFSREMARTIPTLITR
jgi:uncharacterized lipoprotein YmbA